jgi:hypothetical protein
MARAGFGLLSVLLSLLVIGLLGAVVLTQHLGVTPDPRAGGAPGEGRRADRSARLAAGLSAALFATPGGMMSRCDLGGAPPPASPSSGQGC